MRISLNPIPPLGIASAAAESLRSYLARLAGSHVVSVTLMVSRLVPTLARSSPSCEGRKLKANWCHSEGLLARQFGGFTGTDLETLTLARWLPVIAPQGLRRAGIAWCPECLTTDPLPYERLAWTLRPIRWCVEHRRPLVEVCPNCGQEISATQRSLTSWACPKCQSRLCCDQARSSGCATDIDIEDARLCAGLIGDPRSAMGLDGVRAIADSIFAGRGGRSVRMVAEAIGIREGTLWNMLTGASTALRLETWLTIARWLRCSLADLLAGSAKIEMPDIQVSGVRHLPRSRRGRVQSLGEDLAKACEATDLRAPLSTRRLTRSLHTSHKTLRRHFGPKFQALADQRAEWERSKRQEAAQRVEEEIRKAFGEIESAGINPTWYAVRKRLGWSCRSGSRLAKDVLDQKRCERLRALRLERASSGLDRGGEVSDVRGTCSQNSL